MAKLWAGLLLAGSVVIVAFFAQSTEKKPVFETASIKPADTADPGSFWNAHPGLLTVHNMSLKKVVMAAYDVKEYQVSGGPKWLDDDRFDIVAKMDESEQKLARGKEGPARFRTAMQALLADRFQLLIRKESKSMSGFSLVTAVTAKNSFKLKPVDGAEGSSIHTGRGKMTAKAASMERFAGFLATQLDRPVVDATGIEGVFDITLEWAPDEGPEGHDAASADKPAKPSLFTAIQETLGLKLEPQKVPVPIIAIDRAEQPGEN